MAISRILVQTVPRGHFSVHEYELKRYDDGTFPVYKKVPGARKTDDLLAARPTTLEAAEKLIIAGHPARFVADGPTYEGTSVFRIGAQKILVEHR